MSRAAFLLILLAGCGRADRPEAVWGGRGVQDGQLEFSWLYRPEVHDRTTVEAVAIGFAGALRRIAADCRGAL